MKKREFLAKLRKKLSVLEESEVDDIIKEYGGYIDEKIESGVVEEEAVSSFGSIDELSAELLSAYKVKVKEEKEDPIGNFASKVLQTIDKLIDTLSKKTPKEIIRFVIEILILIAIIGLFHIPVAMLVSLGKDVFYILSSPLNRIFFTIWRFVLEFAYFVLAIIVFIRIFDTRYLKNVEVKKEKKVSTPKNAERKSKEIVEVKQSKGAISTISEFIVKICVFFLKFMAICILFCISFYLIGMAIVLVLCIYLLVHGVMYFGFYLVMISLFLLGLIFFWILFNFVLDRKNNGVKMFVSLAVSFVLLGVGCGIAAIEVTETEFINSPPSDVATETLTEELTMDEDTIFIGNISDYVVDNSIENVLVEYRYYPLGTTMSTRITKDDDYVYLNWDLENIYLKGEFLDHMIRDLREKKVYNYYIEPTIVITANEKNIEVIRENRQKYYQSGTNHTSCDFVRTYFIYTIIDREEDDAEESDTLYVVLNEFQSENLVTVPIKRELLEGVTEGYYYEFTFNTYQSYIDTDIENIFEENEVVSIKKTDRPIDEQIHEDSCSAFY